MDFTRMKLEGTWFVKPKPDGREFRIEVHQYEEHGTYGNRVYKWEAVEFKFMCGSSPQASIEESLSRALQDIERILNSEKKAS